MRISEISGPMRRSSVPDDKAERLELLRQKIENGEKPFIASATSARGHFGWGDLRDLGWAERERIITNRHQGLTEEWWVYTGPGPIMTEHGLGGTVVEMNTGDETPPVEVDYS